MTQEEFEKIMIEAKAIDKRRIRMQTHVHPLGKRDLAYFLKYGHIHPQYFMNIRKRIQQKHNRRIR